MTRIQIRRGTDAEWATANPVLAVGEPGFATDTGVFKVGNGTDAWTDLAETADDELVARLAPVEAALAGRLSDASLAAAYGPRDTPGRDIVAILGQSNARGDGESVDVTTLDFTDPRVEQFVGDATNTYYRKPILAVDPLLHHTPSPSPTHGVGLGVVFGRNYVKTTCAYSRSLLLVPSARGTTGFTTTDYCWDPASTPSIENLYNTAIAQITAALALAGGTNRLVAVIWVQGEADTALSQSAYAAKLDGLIDGIRTAFSLPDLPFIVGQMNPDKIAEGDAGYAAINKAHIDTPRRKVHTWFVPGPTGCSNSVTNGGTIHYNGVGQRELGRRCAALLSYAQANVTGTAPVPAEALTLTQSGTTVTAAWTPGKGRATNYTLQYRLDGGSWTTVTRADPLVASALITGLTLGSLIEARVATVNEAGTSGYTSASMTLDVLPGQVLGLTSASTASNRVNLTWTTLTGARTYKVEYKRAIDSTWLVFAASVATNSAAVTGLLSSTSYNFRVTAINNAGTSATPSSTYTTSTSALSLMATTVGAEPLFGYSASRKLSSSFAGSPIRVRRSSDNVEADIGFTALGILDEAALLAHVGAGDGFVSKVYQQGTATTADLAQATTTLQPKIVVAGVVNRVNGVPAILFTGTQYLSHSSPSMFTQAAITALMTHTAPASAASAAVFGEDNNGTAGYYFPAYYNGAGQPTFYDGSTARVGAGLVLDGHLMQQTSQDTGSALTIAIDGVSKLNYTPYTPPGSTVVRMRLGAYVPGAASSFYNGSWCEAVAWASVLGTTPRADGEANQKTFYGTP